MRAKRVNKSNSQKTQKMTVKNMVSNVMKRRRMNMTMKRQSWTQQM